MLQVCTLAFAGLFAALVLKKDKPEYATLVILLVSFFIAMKSLGILEGILEQLEEWGTLLQDNRVYVKLMLKMIGITYLCEFAANLCKDSGYSALSNHIELFGKIAIMVAGFPVIRSMLEILEEILR